MLSTFEMINGLLEILELLTLRSKIILFVHAINEYKKACLSIHWVFNQVAHS